MVHPLLEQACEKYSKGGRSYTPDLNQACQRILNDLNKTVINRSDSNIFSKEPKFAPLDDGISAIHILGDFINLKSSSIEIDDGYSPEFNIRSQIKDSDIVGPKRFNKMGIYLQDLLGKMHNYESDARKETSKITPDIEKNVTAMHFALTKPGMNPRKSSQNTLQAYEKLAKLQSKRAHLMYALDEFYFNVIRPALKYVFVYNNKKRNPSVMYSELFLSQFGKELKRPEGGHYGPLHMTERDFDNSISFFRSKFLNSSHHPSGKQYIDVNDIIPKDKKEMLDKVTAQNAASAAGGNDSTQLLTAMALAAAILVIILYLRGRDPIRCAWRKLTQKSEGACCGKNKSTNSIETMTCCAEKQ